MKDMTPEASITPDMISRYLFARKWRLKHFDGVQAVFERRGEFGMLGIETPVNPRAEDYIRRLSETLVNLSILEHRPQWDVYYDMLKLAEPNRIHQGLYLTIGLIILGFSGYSWYLLWGF